MESNFLPCSDSGFMQTRPLCTPKTSYLLVRTRVHLSSAQQESGDLGPANASAVDPSLAAAMPRRRAGWPGQSRAALAVARRAALPVVWPWAGTPGTAKAARPWHSVAEARYGPGGHGRAVCLLGGRGLVALVLAWRPWPRGPGVGLAAVAM